MKKVLFIDRDGCIVVEPEARPNDPDWVDYQLDSLEKLKFLPYAISSLKRLSDAGYTLVMVSNQDGLGQKIFPQKDFDAPQNFILKTLAGEGVQFEKIFICPHFEKDKCECRKPKTGLLQEYLSKNEIDLKKSYVIGDRQSDMQLAQNIGCKGIQIGKKNTWKKVAAKIVERRASVQRKTKETDIRIAVNLDGIGKYKISTGLSFFDHMLEQLSKHSLIDINIEVKGDLHIDEHHTIEDTGIALGEALSEALGDKKGIERFGFVLPMDESLAQVGLDFSGRTYCVFTGKFKREKVGDMPTEMVKHFFQSLAQSLKATLNIQVQGENEHHMIEACFKGMARALKMAVERNSRTAHILPSTKGTL